MCLLCKVGLLSLHNLEGEIVSRKNNLSTNDSNTALKKWQKST